MSVPITVAETTASGTEDTTGAAPDPSRARLYALSITAIFVIQLFLLAAVGWNDRYQADVDGFSYLRAAHYYANGQFDLAVNGYWGPMLSWLMAPLLPLVSVPLFAARIAMAISAMVFTFGGFTVLRRLELPPLGVVGGTLVTALFAVVASVEGCTPDLLVGGLMCLAMSRILVPCWPARRSSQIAAGVLFGVAYYAKSVALPIGVTMIVLVALAVWISRHARLRCACTAAMYTLAALALTALPWITVLSIKYDGLTFSTTARIAHALPGPEDVERSHPFGRSFAVPEPGRISWWEDPSRMSYAYWSPLSSTAYLRHQIGIVFVNIKAIVGYLWAFDGLHLGMFGALIGLFVHLPWRRNLVRERWRWAGLGVIALCAIYLPVFALGPRYYFATVPFLFAASFGVAWSLGGLRRAHPALQLVTTSLVILSFCMPSVALLPERLTHGGPRPVSMIVGERLRELDYSGPIVGDTMEGLMTSYFANQPFYGGSAEAGPRDYMASGAELIVTVRSYPIVSDLDETPGVVNLDSELFASSERAERCPLKVYRIERDAGAVAGAADPEAP